jgi:hypothetical protein
VTEGETGAGSVMKLMFILLEEARGVVEEEARATGERGRPGLGARRTGEGPVSVEESEGMLLPRDERFERPPEVYEEDGPELAIAEARREV